MEEVEMNDVQIGVVEEGRAGEQAEDEQANPDKLRMSEQMGRNSLVMRQLRSRNSSTGMEDALVKFANMNVVAGKGEKQKHILREVEGTVKCGHVLAVMGPSGAGKTTLINALTLDAFGVNATGVVELNGVQITDEIFKRHCFVVKQQDKHWAYLTCRETLTYVARLYDIAELKHIPTIVDAIISKMGLDSCKDTRAGSLSGGQKRRLSIAMALVKEPNLLFLDEPTSGLDAAAASHIMQEIRRIAKLEKLIIVCTIHQPSTKVYNGFDQIMILSKGREAFSGHVGDAEGYFDSIGYPMPAATNPAEFFLDLVNADFSADEEVDKLLDTWKDHKKSDNSLTGPEGLPEDTRKFGSGLMKEIPIMFSRHLKLMFRDPVLYWGRTLFYFMANAVFAIVYLKARPFDQAQALNKMWINIWFIGVPSNMGVVAVYVLNDEFKSLRSEIKNGMVSPVSYVLAKSVLVLPIMLFWGVMGLSVSGYAIQGFYPPTYFIVIAIWAVSMFTFECMAEAMSIWMSDPILGMLNYMNIWFAAFLFAGFLIPLDDMFWPFKAFYYCMPLAYSVRGTVYAQFIDATWESCNRQDNPQQAVCVPSEDGAAVLDAVGRVYPLISSDNTLVEDFGIMIAIAVFWKIVYITGVVLKGRKVALVKAP